MVRGSELEMRGQVGGATSYIGLVFCVSVYQFSCGGETETT